MKKTIKKQFSVKTAVCLFGVTFLLILSGCSGPFSGGDAETTTITINLGGGGRAVAPDNATLAQLIYEAVLTGPSTITVGPTEPGMQTLSISVAPGHWDITVTAYLDGEVYAEGSGSAEVRSGQSSSVVITMKEIVPVTVVPVTGVSLDKTLINLAIGFTEQLTATITPADATNKDVIWSMGNNNAIASVSSNGLVTALKVGTATVTVTTVDGNETATCAVTVTTPTFTTITDFASWLSLSSLPANTSASPYNVKLNVSDLAGINSALYSELNKYVNLDLSGSTFTSIDDNTFQYCSNLTGITLPSNGVTSIGMSAFESCGSLTSIAIPNSVTVIGERAFDGCYSLTSVTISSGVNHIDARTFRNCGSLTSIGIPNIVTVINSQAFESSGLTSVTIPAGVTNIYGQAFLYCYSLTTVEFLGGTTNISSTAFDGDLYTVYQANQSSGNALGIYTTSDGVTWTKN